MRPNDTCKLGSTSRKSGILTTLDGEEWTLNWKNLSGKNSADFILTNIATNEKVFLPEQDWTITNLELQNLIDAYLGKDDLNMAPKKKGALPRQWKVTEQLVQSPTKRILLYGPPGTGKTSIANRLKATDETVYNITLTEETPAAELRGFYHIVDGNFAWVDGPATKAFRYGHRLVLNEIDHASGDTHTFLLNLLDDFDIAAITLPTEETVQPHEDFRVIATMNGHPHDLPVALRDRFSVAVNIDQPHPNAILSLPKDLQNIANRTAKIDDPLRRRSPRSWFAFAEVREYFDDEREAAYAVFGDQADDIVDAIKIEAAR